MNAREVAKLLGVHPNTIYNMIRRGEVDAVKKGRSFEIAQEDVKTLLHSKDFEELGKAQESAAFQLIINLNSEIEGNLWSLQRWSAHLSEDMISKGLGVDGEEGTVEGHYEKRRLLYEEEEFSTLSIIMEHAKEILRLKDLRRQLEEIGKGASEHNTLEKSASVLKRQLRPFMGEGENV